MKEGMSLRNLMEFSLSLLYKIHEISDKTQTFITGGNNYLVRRSKIIF
jgi:hypothetical protein